MKKNKNNEVYSFKAISSQASSQGSLSESRKQQYTQKTQFNQLDSFNRPQKSIPHFQNKIKSGIYRHETPWQKQTEQPELNINLSFKKPQMKPFQSNSLNPFHELSIHPKVASLDLEIEENVKRRIQLEKQLNKLREFSKPQQVFTGDNMNLEMTTGMQAEFAFRNKQSDFVDQLIEKGENMQILSRSKGFGRQHENKGKQQKVVERLSKINKNVEILTDSNMQTILKNGFGQEATHTKSSKGFYDLESFLALDKNNSTQISSNHKHPSKNPPKPLSTPTPPPITAIQQLLSQLTFPQIPKTNIQKLHKKSLQLYAIHQSHSDLVYLMMVASFHMGDFHEVRKFFKEILTFKKFQLKAYWVAAETEYVLGNYERCIKLSDYCMEKLEDQFLPRFLYLKAKCYYQQGNFTNSIVCYNQLIRIKPKISQYYLERAILYDKLGYEKQCKQDYLMFGILKPQVKKYLQEKIMVEENDGKRKELLQIYKRMV